VKPCHFGFRGIDQRLEDRSLPDFGITVDGNTGQGTLWLVGICGE
jgi:hypothetical protein